MVWVLVLAIAAPAAPDPAALKADLDRWDRAIEAGGKYPVRWTEAEVRKLAQGEPVKRRTRLDGADRVLGAGWTPTTLAELWTAVQDEHWGLVEGLVEEDLPGSRFEDRLVYQRIEAPWPFKDRQWVIRVQNNVPLWESSGHQLIERTWDLSSERGAKAEKPDAVWISVNEGGWLAFPAAGGSVVVYHVRAVIGGSLPDDAASSWTMMTLGGMMRGLVERSAEQRAHYTGDHRPILWPGGSPIPVF